MKKSKTQNQSFGSSGRKGHDSSLFYDSKLYKNLDFKEDTDMQKNIEGSIQKNAINQIFLKSSSLRRYFFAFKPRTKPPRFF